MARKSQLKQNFSSFCALTGLHGFSYLSRDGHWLERLFWSLAVTISLTWAFVNTARSFLEFGKRPLFFNVGTLQYNASLVPFPAITFCPQQVLDEMNMLAVTFDQV